MTMIKIEFPADRTDIAKAIGQALTAIGNGGQEVIHTRTTSTTLPAPGSVPKGTPLTAVLESHAHAEESDLKFYGIYTAAKRGVILNTREELAAARTDPDFTLVDLPRYEAALAEWAGKPEEKGPFYILHQESESGDIVQTWKEVEAALSRGCDNVTKEHYERTMAKWAIAGAETTVSTDVDTHGTPFNAEFCAKAASPFYGSGKKKGQWKKRQGVEETAYDAWYASAKPEPEHKEPEHKPDLAANTFGAPQTAGEDVPRDAGSLMKWVSEQQTAGNIAQQDVNAAFVSLQMPFDGLMNADAAVNCEKMYNHLKGLI